MRSPRERAAWTALALVLLAAAVAAWWTAERWLPHAGPWAAQAWHRMTRPGPETLPRHPAGAGARAQAPARAASTPPPRRCVHDGHSTYTDQPCPPGSQELPLDGALTTLPARR